MPHLPRPLIALPVAVLVAVIASAAPASGAAPTPSPAGAIGTDQAVGTTRLVSLRYDGSQTTEQNVAPSFSDNARYVAYTTEDRFLTGPDKTPCCQAVRYDRKMKQTEVISLNRKGNPAKGGGNEPVLSADGTILTFWSSSKRLVRRDHNDAPDVFVRDLTTGKTTLVSRTPDGTSGNGDSRIASISADGRYVTFDSDASNLVAGDNNQITDIFLYDAKTKKVTLVSRGLDGKTAKGQSLQSEISADGSHVVYSSSAENIVKGDSNHAEDVFAYDVAAGTTQLISVAEDGTQGDGGSFNPSVSGDGLFVTFWSFATNFSSSDDNQQGDVFVRTTDSPKITLVSHTPDGQSGDNESDDPAIATDGRSIAFQSAASDLDPADTNGFTDIYRYDIDSGAVTLVSATPAGGPPNDSSFLPALSGDGGYVTFESVASDLVSRDTNGVSDVFVTRLD